MRRFAGPSGVNTGCWRFRMIRAITLVSQVPEEQLAATTSFSQEAKLFFTQQRFLFFHSHPFSSLQRHIDTANAFSHWPVKGRGRDKLGAQE